MSKRSRTAREQIHPQAYSVYATTSSADRSGEESEDFYQDNYEDDSDYNAPTTVACSRSSSVLVKTERLTHAVGLARTTPKEQHEEEGEEEDTQSRQQHAWKFERNFVRSQDALDYVKANNWRFVREDNTSKLGTRSYFRCGWRRDCKAKIYLQLIMANNSVSVFDNSLPHQHPPGSGGGAGSSSSYMRGLSDEMKLKVKSLYR
jgi:hypothetical protein